MASVDVHVHHFCALDFAIKVCLIAINRKLIVLFPCFDMLFQAQQIMLLNEWCFEIMNIVGQLIIATC